MNTTPTLNRHGLIDSALLPHKIRESAAAAVDSQVTKLSEVVDAFKAMALAARQNGSLSRPDREKELAKYRLEALERIAVVGSVVRLRQMLPAGSSPSTLADVEDFLKFNLATAERSITDATA